MPEQRTAPDLFEWLGKMCYYRTERGTPADPEWIPVYLQAVGNHHVEVIPEPGTPVDTWYKANTDPTPNWFPALIKGIHWPPIRVTDLDRIHLPT